MLKIVEIDGQKHRIDQSNIIGSGGEASVVKVDNSAVKIYHNPNQSRIDKLQDLINSAIRLPDSVCAPQKLARDSKGNIVGFAMRLVTGHNEVVKQLSSKSYRRANPHMTSKIVTGLMLDGYQTIASCHPLGVVIGDNNDLNVLFNNKYLTFIDADSFQIGKHPCVVGTEDFLPPELYNLDLTKQCYYKPEHDWYSWFVMFIRSVLMVHIYGGTHLGYKTLPQRALARIIAFDPEVTLPKVALRPEVLDDNILSLVDRMFKKGERFVPPKEAFIEYMNSLVSCNSCGVMFSGERKNCPQCATINTQQVQRRVKVNKTNKRTVHSDELLSVDYGEFIWHKLYYKNLFAVSLGKGSYYLHCKIPGQNPTIKPLFKAKNGSSKFDMFFGRFLVVNESPMNEELLIFDISLDPIKGMTKRPVSPFNGELVFGCSQDDLFRVHEGVLLRSKYSLTQKDIFDNQVNSVVKNQTRIFTSPTGTTVLGLLRSFNVFTYFVYSFDKSVNGEYWTNTLTDLDSNESVIDVAVYFHGSAQLLILKTEIIGKTYTRVYLIKNGQELTKYRLASLSSDAYRNIHGKAFMFLGGKAIILHPTDDGIIQEVLGDQRTSGTQTLLEETEPFVAESDSLFAFEKGIVVVGDKEINYLTLT